MRTWRITIIIVGMTIGFHLALGIVALLRAVLEGEFIGLSIAFTVLVLCFAVSLIVYVVKSTRPPGRDSWTS